MIFFAILLAILAPLIAVTLMLRKRGQVHVAPADVLARATQAIVVADLIARSDTPPGAFKPMLHVVATEADLVWRAIRTSETVREREGKASTSAKQPEFRTAVFGLCLRLSPQLVAGLLGIGTQRCLRARLQRLTRHLRLITSHLNDSLKR